MGGFTMKRYMICLFLFVGVGAVCLTAAYFLTGRYRVTASPTREESAAALESVDILETVPENLAAVNGEHVLHEKAALAEEFYLVSEDGFLLVFGKDQETICLYTHIPLMDFPAREQERLREGIWFPGMMEVIQYLESYTS